MIRPYKHINSKFHKVQSFVNHLFLDVVFRAPHLAADEFNSSLLLPKYKSLIDDVNEEYLLNPIKECYKICRKLSPDKLKLLRRGVHHNNKIRLLCNGELKPLEYEDIMILDVDLSKQLKLFFDQLYDDAISKAAFYKIYGKIDDYYKDLVGKSRTCRCCGINKVLIKFHSKRSALDHYLPRSHFPFTSLNCNNLVPICDTCNSKYKLAENTIFTVTKKGKKVISKERKKAFYPFFRITPPPKIQIEIKFKKLYSSSIEPKDIDLTLSCAGYEEQVASWDRIFGIQENYLAECCSDEMFSYYEEQYIADLSFGKSHQDYISLLAKNKFDSMNFLRIAFLESIK